MSPSKTTQNYILLCLVILTCVALAVTFIYTKPVLLPFVFAVFYYFATVPILRFFEQRFRLRPIPSLLLTLTLSLSFAFVVVTQILFSIGDLIDNANIYQTSFYALSDHLKLLVSKFGYTLDEQFVKNLLKTLPIASYAKTFAADMLVILANTFLIAVIYFFLMMGRSKAQNKKPILMEIEKKVSSYIVNKILLSLLTAVLVFAVLKIFSVKMAFLFGVVAFLLNFIPSVGSIIATLLPLPMVLLQLGFGFEFWVILVFTSVVQLLIGNFIDPKIIGKDLDLHPIAIILSLVFWGIIWGTAGVFVAVPMTAAIKIVLARLETTRSFSEILAGRI